VTDSQSPLKAAPRTLTAKDWRDKGLHPNAYRKACQAIFRTLREVRGHRDLPATTREFIDGQFIDLSRVLITEVLYPLSRRKGRPQRAVPKTLFTEYMNPLLARCGLPCYKTYIARAVAESETKCEACLRGITEILADLLPSGRRGRPSFRPAGLGIIRGVMEYPDAKRVNELAVVKTRQGMPNKKAVIEALEELGSLGGINKLDYYLKRLSEALKQAKRS